MNYVRAAINWGHVSVRAAGYGAVSLTGGLFAHEISQWAMRNWCAGAADGLGINRRLVHPERLHSAPQAVIIANHLSLLDILVLGSFMRQDYRWLAKEQVFRVPFMGWHLHLAGHIPVNRTAGKTNRHLPTQIHKVVEDGASVLFFPEGTRSSDGELKSFRMGAFTAAVREGLPVLPLVLRGTHELLVKGALDLDVDQTRACSVTALPLVHAPAEGSDKARAVALRNAAHAAIHQELYDRPPEHPNGLAPGDPEPRGSGESDEPARAS